MKIGKRLFTSLLAFVMIITCVMPGIVPTAEAAITYSAYEAKVAEFVADYRWQHGTSWGTISPKLSHWQSSGCCAFVADFAAYVYGCYGNIRPQYCADFTDFYNPAEIRTGDIVHYNKANGSEHWFVVLERNGDQLYTAEGNASYDGTPRVHISRDIRYIENGQLKSKLSNSDNAITSFDGYHYKFADDYNAQLYKKECEVYPTYGTIIVSKNEANINDRPCSKKTDATTRTILKGAVNAEYRVTAAYKNTEGNYWYEVMLNEYDRGYIYSENCIYYVNFDDVALHNANVPTKLPMNASFTLGGTVSSIATKIFSVTVNLYDTSGNLIVSDTKDAVYNQVDMSAFTFQISSSKPSTIKCEVVASVAHYNINTEKYPKGSTKVVHQSDILLTCTEHKFGNWTVTKAPTCTAEGSRTHTCTICGESASEAVAATGHNWTVQSSSGITCTTPAYTNSICLNCGETKSEKGEVTWSDWTAEYPQDMALDRIETKQQYRYRELDSNWQAVETGYVDYVASWPDGFDYNSSYRTTFGQTPKTPYENEAQRLSIVSDETVGYLYYHWCRGRELNQLYNSAISTNYTDTFWCFHAYYSTNYIAFDSSANAWNAGNWDCCHDTYWYFQIPVKRQTYSIENKQFEGERWGDWGEWSDTAVTATDSRQVETRNVYRYITDGLADHNWDDGVRTKDPTVETEGEWTYTCTVCGAKKIEMLPKLPAGDCAHTLLQLKNAVEATCTAAGYTGDLVCDNCGKIVDAGSAIPVTEHTIVIDEAVAATCTATGMTDGEHCFVCGKIFKAKTEIAALGHEYQNGVCTRCGDLKPTDPTDPSTPVESEEGKVVRHSGKDRCLTAQKAADAMKSELGVENFDAVIYASGTNFADALAGSYLSAVKNAPILLHTASAANLESNVEYIKNNLAPGGKVYILGGTAAVPESAETAFNNAGIQFERVKGKTRFQTNIEILKAGGFSGGKMLVCTAENFADSLSASATGLPILLVSKTWTDLSAEQKTYLSDKGSCEFVIIGGTGAVKAEMEEALKNFGTVKRIKGKTRYETSIEVAKEFFPAPTSAVLAYAENYPDGLCGGALAYAKNAPLILTKTGSITAAKGYVSGMGITSGAVLGGTKLIDDASVREIFNMAENAEIAK